MCFTEWRYYRCVKRSLVARRKETPVNASELLCAELSFIPRVATVTCYVAVMHCSHLCSHRRIFYFHSSEHSQSNVKTKYFSTMFQDLRKHPTPRPLIFVDCCMVFSVVCITLVVVKAIVCCSISRYTSLFIVLFFIIIIIILLCFLGIWRRVVSNYFDLLT